jgi:hypothetical protein
MKKKVLINERQLKLIVEEETLQNRIVKKIAKYLDTFYEPVKGISPKGDEYVTKGLVLNLVDETQLTPKVLRQHLEYKFGNLNKKFYQQVINDWFNGKLKNNFILSKPVKMN